MKLLACFFVMMIVSCVQQEAPKQIMCAVTSDEAFDSVKSFISQKNFEALTQLYDQYDSFISKPIDTIFKSLKQPSISLIPEESDGAYGIKHMGNADLYYAQVYEEGKPVTIKGIMFQKNGGCYKLINISTIVNSRKK